MKYMGSKRELIDQIESKIDSLVKKDSTVLDLFAGTCSLGISLCHKYSFISNDIQNYSKVISKGVIEVDECKYTIEEIRTILSKNLEKNMLEIEKSYKRIIKKSQQIAVSGNRLEYIEFMNNVPNPINSSQYRKEEKWVKGLYSSKSTFPYVQNLYLFSEMYFSTKQASTIDSYKYAIDKLKDKNLANMLNVCLIHAFSYISAGTGHFAQFRDMKTDESFEDVMQYRTKSFEGYFYRKAEELLNNSKALKGKKSKSYSMNYIDILSDSSIMKKVDVIYADPPYSFVHYSRFYHATESLVRYDYPEVLHKGRYRNDRHQSPFCIKTKAFGAFLELFTQAKKYKIPVVLSYSNTGMITVDEIKKASELLNMKFQLQEIKHKHSTMGRRGDKSRDVLEALITVSYF